MPTMKREQFSQLDNMFRPKDYPSFEIVLRHSSKKFSTPTARRYRVDKALIISPDSHNFLNVWWPRSDHCAYGALFGADAKVAANTCAREHFAAL